MRDEYFVFDDLRNQGIPYSRNRLGELIKLGLFPPGRRFTKKGRRHWTNNDIEVGKQNFNKSANTTRAAAEADAPKP
jgi:hypothetical protein